MPSTQPPLAPPTQVSQVVEKLRRTAARPNEKYIDCLREYAEGDAEEGGAASPTGYRERVAPSWLGEAVKQWRSKVDEVLWRRLDPAKANIDELSFVNRKVEEEIRAEVERDASILKSFAKLRERQGAGADPS